MHFSELLKTLEKNEISDVKVVHFQVPESEIPTQFFALFLSRVREIMAVSSLDTELQELADIKAQLEVSFLGSRLLYWVKNVHTLDAATKKAWFSYIKSYQGPHCILFFDDAKKLKDDNHLIVELPDKVDMSLYQTLASFFYPQLQRDDHFLSQLFFFQKALTLDEACRLMAYQLVVGRKCESFFSHWFTRLIVPEKSFFTLSQHLFAQQPYLFLKQWKACKSDYPEEFWIAYWSEQLWQASLFVSRARTLGIQEAKKSAYRLPFSFINKDWQRYTVDSLVKAHQSLYLLDYHLKNGAGTNGLELWYHKMMLA